MYKICFPFNDIDNNVTLFHYIRQKKITAFSKKTNANKYILTERFNDMMNQEEFGDPSAYYNYKRFNENFDQNIYNGTNILHININSLSYHFDNFRTVILQLYIKFDIIGITETCVKN